jgi:glycerol-3-phosphate acyltransferase PlsY
MIDLLTYLLALLPFYLIGAFPTGMIVARRYGVAIDRKGSGNVGAANVYRVVGKGPAALTLFGDAVKGVLAVTLGSLFASDPGFPNAAGLAAVLGHCVSIPPLLRGGKGVATSLGVVLVLAPTLAAVATGVYVVGAKLSGMSAVGSLAAALLTPLFTLLFGMGDLLFQTTAALAVIIVVRHRTNIERLIEGKRG